LRRNAKALEEKQTGGAVCVPRALIDWIDRTIALVGNRDELSRREYRRQAKALEREFKETFVDCQPTNEANRRMVDRLRSCHDAVVRSLRDLRVPATNNHAERQIRPSVVTRKRGGCNRSQRGVRAFEVITSLLVSARQRKVDIVDYLVDLLRQDPLQPEAAFW
jgi:transposase